MSDKYLKAIKTESIKASYRHVSLCYLIRHVSINAADISVLLISQ